MTEYASIFLESIEESNIQITGEDAHHIGYALRMRPGDALTVCANGRDYHCRIRKLTADTVYLDAESSVLCAAEPSVAITLYQAVPKSDKLAQIIQKSVELGVVRIVPVLTRRCVARPSTADFQKKLPRLQKLRRRLPSRPAAAAFRKWHRCIPFRRRSQRCSRQSRAFCFMRAVEYICKSYSLQAAETLLFLLAAKAVWIQRKQKLPSRQDYSQFGWGLGFCAVRLHR